MFAPLPMGDPQQQQQQPPQAQQPTTADAAPPAQQAQGGQQQKPSVDPNKVLLDKMMKMPLVKKYGLGPLIQQKMQMKEQEKAYFVNQIQNGTITSLSQIPDAKMRHAVLEHMAQNNIPMPMAMKTKIPVQLQQRIAQADLITDQIEDVRRLLKDGEVQKWMGPVVGNTIGPIARRYSRPVQQFYAAQESLAALQPIIHAYRGGARTHAIFESLIGGLGMKPEAFEGGLDALNGVAVNMRSDVRKTYPDDPYWKEYDKGHKAGGKEPAKDDGKDGVIVVSPEDLKN